MTTQSVLESAFTSLNQCLKTVFLDFVWRFLWGACALLGLLFFWVLMISRLESVEWQGPELGATNPIMLLAALQAFWNAEGAFLVSVAVVFLMALTVLWVALESLFRGGAARFWIYFGTGIARVLILAAGGIFFFALSGQDETNGTVLIGLVTMLATWFSVALLEAVLRRHATALMGMDFARVAGVMGTVLVMEALVSLLLWAAAALVMFRASGEWLLVAGPFVVFVLLVWMVVHSYLVAVRYTAIDIMRRNVVGS